MFVFGNSATYNICFENIIDNFNYSIIILNCD